MTPPQKKLVFIMIGAIIVMISLVFCFYFSITPAIHEQVRVKSTPQQSHLSSAENLSLNIYSDARDHYSVQYPLNWDYKKNDEHTVLFEGKPGIKAHFSSVIIAVIPAQTALIYKNLSDVMGQLKKHIAKQRPNVRFVDTGTVTLPTNPKNIHGQSFIATYTIKGHEVKHSQFLLMRDDDKTIYSWIYVSPVEQYNSDLNTVKEMYQTWKIE